MSFLRFAVLILPALCSLPTAAWSADAKSIIDKMFELQSERRSGVDSYIVEQSTMGQRTVTLYERTTVDLDGQSVEAFRVVPPAEIARRRSGNGPALTPFQLEQMANAYEETGVAVSNEMDRGMTEAGLPPELLGALGAGSADEPWASPDPAVMMGAGGEFLRGAAAAQRDAGDGSAEARQNAQGMAAFADSARLVGSERVNGTAAYHLRADDLGDSQVIDDGGEFTLHSVSVWVDEDKYVPLRMVMRGEATSDGETRDVEIEQVSMDYRQVAGSRMYESYRQIMRIGGVMSDEDRAQLAEARAQLEEFRAEMASMPPGQQEMMKRMMGPQLEMFEKMASGGGFEFVTEVHEIRVDN